MGITKDIQPPTGGGRTFENLVPSGIYSGTITEVEDCEIPPFNEGDPIRSGIRFNLKVDVGGITELAKHEVTASLGERAKLRKLLDNLLPGQVAAAMGVQGQIPKLINSLEGKNVQVIVGEKVSKTGSHYSIIEGIMPGGKGAQPVGGNSELEEVPLESDDIPF